jgi:dihydrofolate reductase
MRKLKLQVQMSIDGFIAAVGGEMDWLTMDWSDDINAYVDQITDPVDTILLGKNLAIGFIPHWTAAYNSPDPIPGAQKMVETLKIVFTKTLKTANWENTILNNGDLVDEINALKQQSGGDIIAYGGGTFVSALIKEQLIDELHFFINPVVLGNGMPIFQAITAHQPYKLVSSIPFDCGIIALQYKPV